MFPVDTDAHAMGAPLPRESIAEVELPGQVLRKSRPPDGQAGLDNANLRCADAKTPGTILFPWRIFAGAGEEIRKAEIVDQCIAQHAGEAEQALIGPS
jgi:hypothetical protein